MNNSKIVLVGMALGFFLVPAGGQAQAQNTQFSFQGYGGIGIPVDQNLYDPGASFGGAFTWWANETVGIRIGGDVDLLSGKPASEISGPVSVPDMNLYHYRGGIVFRAVQPEANRLTVNLDVLGGASKVSVSGLPSSFDTPPFESSEFSELYPAVSGGVEIGYQIADQISGFLSGKAYYIVADREEFEPFAQFDPSNPDANMFTEIWTLPLRGGVSIVF